MACMDSAAVSPRVLVVDDDDDVLASLERGLRLSGFDVSTAKDGAEALRSATETRPDAIVLDINMPVLDGVSVVTALRAMDNDVPVCVLSARSSVDDRVAGLEAGADDYLVKPFVLAELVARVKALLRRRGATATFSSETIAVGPLEVDIPGRRARVNGVDVDLTKREFDLLAVLAEHKTAVLSRAQLLELVWGYDFAADTNVVDVFIGYLRRKLEAGGAPRLLHTVRGVGFVLRSVSPMNLLARIFRRTPSLRTRVALATGHRRGDRRRHRRHRGVDRHHQRPQGAAGPQARRGRGLRDSVPAARARRDPEVTQRPGRRHHRAQGRPGDVQRATSMLPQLPAGYADTYVNGVRYRVRTVDIRVARADVGRRRRHLRRHHRRHQQPASPRDHHLRVRDRRSDRRRVGAGRLRGAAVEAARAADPVDRCRRRTARHRESAAPPRPSRSPTPSRACCERIWNEQDRTKAALASARDFSAVSAHELRTPLTAMRTNLEVLSTLDLPDEQRKEVINDVIRTQSRIEATLGALERLAQGELSTSDDHVPVDITELLDRAAHDAMRVYPDLDVSLVPAPTVIIVGLPAGLRLAVDNAIANAVKHGGATRVQLSAVSSRAGVEIAIDDDGVGIPEEERQVVFERFSRGSTASHSGSGLGLALVAQQAELHGGTASLQASPLGGARLLLRLPGPR